MLDKWASECRCRDAFWIEERTRLAVLVIASSRS